MRVCFGLDFKYELLGFGYLDLLFRLCFVCNFMRCSLRLRFVAYNVVVCWFVVIEWLFMVYCYVFCLFLNESGLLCLWCLGLYCSGVCVLPCFDLGFVRCLQVVWVACCLFCWVVELCFLLFYM